MSDNIFGNNTNQTTDSSQNSGDATPQPTQAPQFADLLQGIKNEQGQPKYRDIPTAIDALKHSQDYISQLKTENERLAREAAAAKAEADKIAQLEATLSQLTSNQQQQVQSPASVIPEEVVANVVQQTLAKREAEALQKANISQVVNQVQQAFGDDAEKVFYTKAQEVGLSAAQINALAAQSPTAVLKLFGLGEQQTQSNMFKPTTPSVNTSGLQPKQQSFIGKNDKPTLIGATTSDLQAERESSKKLVEEIHSQGLSMHDLTDPKVYFKHFK